MTEARAAKFEDVKWTLHRDLNGLQTEEKPKRTEVTFTMQDLPDSNSQDHKHVCVDLGPRKVLGKQIGRCRKKVWLRGKTSGGKGTVAFVNDQTLKEVPDKSILQFKPATDRGYQFYRILTDPIDNLVFRGLVVATLGFVIEGCLSIGSALKDSNFPLLIWTTDWVIFVSIVTSITFKIIGGWWVFKKGILEWSEK